jgi:hypothetical protein
VNRHARICIALLILASALRFHGLGWDNGIGAHPDERHVVGVAEGLRWPDRLNPFDVSPGLAYGHLPLYLLALAAGWVRGVDTLWLGRLLAAFLDLGTVAMTLVLGRRLADARVGLLAATSVALMTLHVQEAHFYTVDTVLTFFVLGTLLFAVRLAGRGRAHDAWLAGALAGLAAGTKLSAALLVVPLATACVVAPGGRRLRWGRTLAAGVAALAVFALTNPFALVAFPVFWANVAREAAIAQGLLDVPYTRQFHATWPYVYPLVQQLRWGMGWPLGLIAFGGLVCGAWRAVRQPPRRAEWVLLAWVWPYLAFVGALHAKFPRYLLPVTPPLALYGARLLLWPRLSRRLASMLVCLCLVFSFLHCLAFVGIYDSLHPWIIASEWFKANAPEGAVVAVEQWDHPLPLPVAGDHDVRELPVFDEDTPEKWEAMGRVLAEADYLVIASRRGYGALVRWPERYPLTARYYQGLFGGELGFEPVACFARDPHLGLLVFADDPVADLDLGCLPEFCHPEGAIVVRSGRLDESYVVYDHPTVVILERTSR